VNEIDALRSEIQDLHRRRDRGDIPSRRFEQALADRSLDLSRAVIRDRLRKGESLLAEHHVIHSHLRLSQSILKEADQQAVSLFGTDRRLFRLRSVLSPGRPATCDSRDETVLDEVPYSSITGIRAQREIRIGEIVAGVTICMFAWAFRSWLEVTGVFLLGLGVFGILHALLLPTRWVEVEAMGATHSEPIKIHAVRKKSARNLLRLLRRQRFTSAPD
jgi:hypothetical protein